MTDQTIPADLHPEDVEHARSYVQDFLDATYAPDRTLAVARVLHALLPAPPPPTLADMTPVARRECQWMQCEVRGDRRIIILVLDDRDHHHAVTLDPYGHTAHCPFESVTPRPDLPPLEWPGDTPTPAPALPDGWRLADHPQHGRGIVTRPVPDRNGYVCFVLHSDGTLGHSWHFCTPDELTYLDTNNQALEEA